MNIYDNNVKTNRYSAKLLYIFRLKATLVKMRLWTGRSSWASTSVSPGGCEICRCLLSSHQVHCADLLFWALSMQAQWYYCAGICPCLYWLFFFSFFFLGMSDQIQADVDRKQTQYLFSSSSTINQLHIFPDSLPGSDPSDRVPHQSASCHSAVGMLLTWFTCLGPDAFKELRFSSLLMMSVHVFLYWCRSREYTKGSQAALL